jgi:hypothetical protein
LTPEVLRKRTAVYRVLLGFNICVPLLYAATSLYAEMRILDGEDFTKSAFVAFFFLITTGILQIVSGVYLIVSVLRIRKFFIRLGGETIFNQRTMMLHASAFAIYLIAAFIYFSV